jgi:hypothetical protein
MHQGSQIITRTRESQESSSAAVSHVTGADPASRAGGFPGRPAPGRCLTDMAVVLL